MRLQEKATGIITQMSGAVTRPTTGGKFQNMTPEERQKFLDQLRKQQQQAPH
jgi:hypothetical protein